HSDAKAFIAHDLLFEAVKNLKSDLLLIKTGAAVEGWQTFADFTETPTAQPLVSDAKEDDASTILYTSGTTGQPKGVLFSHRNILTVAGMICVEMEMKPESRLLHMMPLSHSAPLHLFLVAGMGGGAKQVVVATVTPEPLRDTVGEGRERPFFGGPS